MSNEGKKRKNAFFGRVKRTRNEAICFAVYKLQEIYVSMRNCNKHSGKSDAETGSGGSGFVARPDVRRI